MKLLVLFTAIMLLSSSNAGFFDTLKESFAYLGPQLSCAFQPVLESGKTLGTQLLAHAAQTGSTLAGQALRALSQTPLATTQVQPATNHDPAASAKRDILELFQNLHLAKNQLDHALSDKFGNLHNFFHAGVDSLRGVLEHAAQQASALNLTSAEAVHQIESIVATHNGLVDLMYGDVVKTILEHLEKFALQHGGNKQSVSEVLSSLGPALTQFFQPHVDYLKQTFAGLGGAVTITVNQLQELSNDLASHAHDLVDVLQQTFVNEFPHVLGVLNVGGQMSSTTTSNLANTLGQQPARGYEVSYRDDLSKKGTAFQLVGIHAETLKSIIPETEKTFAEAIHGVADPSTMTSVINKFSQTFQSILSRAGDDILHMN